MGFLQVGNEESTGHVDRFIRVNMPLLDSLAVYFDGADDETKARLKALADVVVDGKWSFFRDERTNKQRLLDAIKASELNPDWILRLDADEALYCSRPELEAELLRADAESADALEFGFINLWRDSQTVRLDAGFNQLRFPAVWRWRSLRGFDRRHGLHLGNTPRGIRRSVRASFSIVHYGFADSELVLRKIDRYERLGQRGWALNRLRDESSLATTELTSIRSHLGSRADLAIEESIAPARWEPWSPVEWELNLSRFRRHETQSIPRVTIVCLIFASTEWLEFAYGEVLRLQAEMGRDAVEILFVANDATREVKDFLAENDVPNILFSGKSHPDEWYINSVYRAYNAGIRASKGRYVLLVNSDMAFSAGFLTAMCRNRAPDLLLTSSLIEPGILEPARGVTRRSFGSAPRNFRRRAFLRFVDKATTDTLEPGCLFMPMLAQRDALLSLGRFPEGNLVADSLDDYVQGEEPRIAERGQEVISGDAALVARAQRAGYGYLTTRAAWAYHFQEGELRASRRKQRRRPRSGVLVANDRLTGINSEEVLWGRLVNALRSEGIPAVACEQHPAQSRAGFWRSANRKSRAFRLSISNGTYSKPIRRATRSTVIVQDVPSHVDILNGQRYVVRLADSVITNSTILWNMYRQKQIYLLQVPLSEVWIQDVNQPRQRPVSGMETGIFVGSFTETKGWPQVYECFRRFDDVHWLAISKHDELMEPGPPPLSNLSIRRQVSQLELRELLGRSDFLILGSPIETQCLAALEAASQDVPVVMPPTGLLASLGPLRDSFGVFDSDLPLGVSRLRLRLAQNDAALQPRATFTLVDRQLNLTSLSDWVEVVRQELRYSFMRPDHVRQYQGLRATAVIMRGMVRNGIDMLYWRLWGLSVPLKQASGNLVRWARQR